MSRGPDPGAELERLKREANLEALVEAAGVKLRRHGADLVGLCPFHEDRGPSLVVTPAKNLWHCLGACGAGGSVVDWVMRREGVSFRHAVEILRCGTPPSPHSSSPAAAAPALAPIARPDAEDRELLRRVVGYYHETLVGSAEAVRYLKKRGIDSVEAVDHFRLGYANRTLGYRLAPKRTKAGEELRGRLERLGILRPSGHEHFRGSLVIPVFGPSGEVLEMYGRKIGERLRAGTPLHLYLPGPHRGVWNEAALTESKEVILTESLIDALTFWAAGFRNVTAAYGVSGFTDEHRQALRRHGTERVLIAYDRDEASGRPRRSPVSSRARESSAGGSASRTGSMRTRTRSRCGRRRTAWPCSSGAPSGWAGAERPRGGRGPAPRRPKATKELPGEGAPGPERGRRRLRPPERSPLLL